MSSGEESDGQGDKSGQHVRQSAPEITKESPAPKRVRRSKSQGGKASTSKAGSEQDLQILEKVTEVSYLGKGLAYKITFVNKLFNF